MLEKQLQITEVSPADLKSKLSIKFKYDAGNKILTDGTLVAGQGKEFILAVG
jgi:hypothetical protein